MDRYAIAKYVSPATQLQTMENWKKKLEDLTTRNIQQEQELIKVTEKIRAIKYPPLYSPPKPRFFRPASNVCIVYE